MHRNQRGQILLYSRVRFMAAADEGGDQVRVEYNSAGREDAWAVLVTLMSKLVPPVFRYLGDLTAEPLDNDA